MKRLARRIRATFTRHGTGSHAWRYVYDHAEPPLPKRRRLAAERAADDQWAAELHSINADQAGPTALHYLPADAYWSRAYLDFYRWVARMAGERITERRAEGLPELPDVTLFDLPRIAA